MLGTPVTPRQFSEPVTRAGRRLSFDYEGQTVELPTDRVEGTLTIDAELSLDYMLIADRHRNLYVTFDPIFTGGDF